MADKDQGLYIEPDEKEKRAEQTVTIKDLGPARKRLTIEIPQERIAKSLDDAQLAQQELQRLQQESVQIVTNARIEAESIVSRSRSDAEQIREELKQKSRAEATAIVQNAERQIQLETTRARDPTPR